MIVGDIVYKPNGIMVYQSRRLDVLISNNSQHMPKKGELWDKIVTLSYFWVANRSSKFTIDWVDWL